MKEKITVIVVVLSLIATPVLAQGAYIDDFEDGQILDTWSTDQGSSGAMTANTTDSLEGTYSAHILYSGGAYSYSDAFGVSNPQNASILGRVPEQPDNRHQFLLTDSGGSVQIAVGFLSSGEIGVSDTGQTTSTGVPIDYDSHYQFLLTNINSTHFDIEVIHENGTTVFQDTGRSRIQTGNIDKGDMQGFDTSGTTVLWDYVTAGVLPSSGDGGISSKLEIEINNWMAFNSSQPYQVILNQTNTTTGDSNITDVTDNANVTIYNITNTTGFSNPIATVNNSTDTIESYNETGVVAVNATYQGETAGNGTNVTVADRNLGNIGILPPGQWICGFLECDGNEDGEFYIGSTTQWLIFIVIVASGFGRAFDNDWIGIGLGVLTAILLWVVGFVGLGMMLSVTFFGIFVGVMKVRVANNSGGETTVNINDTREFR